MAKIFNAAFLIAFVLGISPPTIAQPMYSDLWGKAGEKWDHARLPDFTTSGYRGGKVQIPVYSIIVNIKKYGAAGDGVTDDTRALRKAIRACATNGAIILPAGKYLISDTIRIARSISIRGEGRGKTILLITKGLEQLYPLYGITNAKQTKWSWSGAMILFTGAETSDCGIEDLRIQFPADSLWSNHDFHERAYNAIGFEDHAHDGWVRNVELTGCDVGIWIATSAHNITAENWLLDFEGKRALQPINGHHGVNIYGGYNLLQNFEIRGKFWHDLSVESNTSTHNVFRHGRGTDLCIDHHNHDQRDNLFTNLNAGLGSRLYFSGGKAAPLGICFNETFWGIDAATSMPYCNEKDDSRGRSLDNVCVGIRTQQPSRLEDKDGNWFETIDPTRLYPRDIYEAQRAMKPVKSTPMSTPPADSPLKVACIGASITYGARIVNREQNSYPAQLQRMLGDGYRVTNYGVSGTTLTRKGDNPYWKTADYRAALAANPDIVVIDLGGNDAKSFNRIHLDEYEMDYCEFIQSFRQLPSHPRIILLSAMASFVPDSNGIWEPVIVKQINPKIQQVAYEEQVETIDMHSPFIDKQELFPDRLHPDAMGAGIMAQNVYRAIARPRDPKFDLFASLKLPFTQSSYYGYDCADFTFNGRLCKVVKPKIAAKGHPWIWRARFWGHEPQTEIALLQQGFHVAYCDASELLGNAESIGLWDGFYDLLHRAGVAQKAILEGMSRGGVYVFNWAAVNPDKVAGVYADNPLLNIPSWAVQFLGQAEPKDSMFLAFRKDFGLDSDDDVRKFKGSPVDKVDQIVRGHYPILILCADVDTIVLPEQNTLLFEQNVKQAGGDITVIHKPGASHHPHSLPNPEPIVNFLLKSTGYTLPEKNQKP